MRPHLIPFALGASLLGCVAEVQPPPPPAVTIAPPAPAPPPAPPPLLVVPRAEATPPRPPSPPEAPVAPLRSEGKRHALERTRDGVLILSEERGVVGFLPSSVAGQPIRWAGFVEEDAVMVVVADRALRAASVEAAMAGRFDPVTGFDPSVEVLGAAGKHVVAAAPAEGGAFQISTDGGRTFAAAPRPAKGEIVDLAVRADGFAAVAFAREGKRAEVVVGRGGKGFGKGTIAERHGRGVLVQHGDTISLDAAIVKGQPKGRVGLDARGAWAQALYPASWLGFAWTSTSFAPTPKEPRPGLPKPPPRGDDPLSMVGGVMGGVLSGAECQGVACLHDRSLARSTPALRAYHDGVCAREHVVSRTETYRVEGSLGSPSMEVEQTIASCDRAAPAQRTTTLIAGAGEGAALVKAPDDCAAGRIVGTDRAAFLHCDGQHRGRARLIHVTPAGAFADVVTGLRADERIEGAESTSDGSTVLFAERHAWICRADAPACTALPREGFLTARPLPGGRALVARVAGPQEITLELHGEPGTSAVRVSVPGRLLDLEITAEGHVRLWRSDRLTSRPSLEALARRGGEPALDPLLVGADGALLPDRAGKQALLDAIAAAAPSRR